MAETIMKTRLRRMNLDELLGYEKKLRRHAKHFNKGRRLYINHHYLYKQKVGIHIVIINQLERIEKIKREVHGMV